MSVAPGPDILDVTGILSPYLGSSVATTAVVGPDYLPDYRSDAGPRGDLLLLTARDMLNATGEFGRAECGTGPLDYNFEAEWASFVLLWMEESDENDDADSGDEVDIVHTCKFMIRLAVRHDDPMVRLQRMEYLTSVIKDTLDGKSIGGSFPDLTKVGRKAVRDKQLLPPTAGKLFHCEAQWLIYGFGGQDVMNDEAA